MIDHVVILAGGYGTRLSGLTKTNSKAMLNVNGKPLVDYTLAQIIDIANRWITVGPFKQELMANSIKYGSFNFIDTQDEGNSWFLFHSAIKKKMRRYWSCLAISSRRLTPILSTKSMSGYINR